MLKNYLSYIYHLIQKIIGFRDWSMRYGTNLSQVVNIAFALVFIYVFGFANEAISTAPIYSAFVPFPESKWWLLMPTIVVLQLVFMLVKSLRCDVLSGFVLLLSVPVWTFISIKFANAGFANTATYVYGIWAFTCFIAGWRMMDLYDYKLLLKRRGGRNATVVSNRAKCSNHTASVCSNGGWADGRLLDIDTESKD